MDYANIYHQNFINAVNEKLPLLGDVKTIKFVRQQAGLSMLQAKKFVDFCKTQQ